MKFIGPFLRINSLNKDNIKNQMFHLSKETMKHLVLESKCGISIAPQELCKHSSNIDINTIKHFSPLLTIYKKASAKLSTEGEKLRWNKDKFKKEIIFSSNAFMTLSLLELADYYRKFENIDKGKYNLGNVYLKTAKKQLEFYGANLRNTEGVFVDKLDESDPLLNELNLKDKQNKYKFSDQGFIMAAYYKYSTFAPTEDTKNQKDNEFFADFRKFSLDILNMLSQFKEEIYKSSYIDRLKLCCSLNLFYTYSKDLDCANLLLDLFDMLLDEYEENLVSFKDDKILVDSLLLMNSCFMYKNTKFSKFKDKADEMHNGLVKLFNPQVGMYIRPSNDKKIEYSALEISAYLCSLNLYSGIFQYNDDENILSNVFKNGLVNSGLILSWPDTPNLNDSERYKNFSKNSEDLVEECNFRLPNIPTPENSELAPIFIKRVSYNKKKEVFDQGKSTFDSTKNMPIFFMNIFLYDIFS